MSNILEKSEDVKITYTTSLPNGLVQEFKDFAYKRKRTANT